MLKLLEEPLFNNKVITFKLIIPIIGRSFMNIDTRIQPRYDLNLIVEIKSHTGTENYHLGMTKNISAEGFTLESQNYNIQPGHILKIDIKHPDNKLSISAIGKGVWVKVTEFECLTGIIFMGLDEHAKNRIAQLYSSAMPKPANDMHHNHVPDSNSSKIESVISEAVNTASNINVPVNDDPSIPEDSHNAYNRRAILTDGIIEQPAAITKTKENIPLSYGRDEISRKEPPRYSAPAVKSRTAAKVSARKKHSDLPFAVISIVTVIAIASVLGVMKWKSKAPAPDSSQIAFNETNPAIINKEPSQIETLSIQDIEEAKEIANYISGKEQPIISAPTEQENELNDTGFYQESVTINDIGIQSPEPEQDETVTKKNEAPPESSAASVSKTPAVKIDTSTAKDAVAARKEIESIPGNDKPGKIIIPATVTKQASLKKIRQKIMRNYKQTQKPSAVTKRDVEMAPARINDNQGPSPVIKVPETPKPVIDSTVIAEAGRSDNMRMSRNDTISAAEPGLRDTVIASAAQDNKKSVSEPVSSAPAPPMKNTLQGIPDKIKLLPSAEEKQVYARGSITFRDSPQKLEANKTSEIISSSTSGMMKSYDEPFDNNTNDWDIFNTGSASAHIRNGAYIIENKREKGAHLLLHHDEFPAVSDFSIETSIRLLKNSATASFGLIFGAEDSLNNYAFQITTNRLYIVRNYDQGISREMTMEKKGTADFNIYTLNKLKIIKSGNNMSFYINNKIIDKITDLHLYGKRIGFIITGRSKIAVEHMHSEIQLAN